MPATLDPLPLIGRPASVKSEIHYFLKHLPASTRRERHPLAKMNILDHLPLLCACFEKDTLLPRRQNDSCLHTTEEDYFTHPDLWHLCRKE